MSKLFGGSKSKSTSDNKAFGQIQGQFGPVGDFTKSSGDAISALLGGDSTGFDKFKAATGYDAMAEQGSRGITGNAAAKGVLRSGGLAKGLQTFGTNLQNQFADSYMGRLLGLGQMGLGAGGLLANAGQTSTSTQKSKPGLGGFIGQALSGTAASDRSLKTDIKQIGVLRNGLPFYAFTYIHTGKRAVGVMADEVRKLLPEALGPKMFGYDTVNYDVVRKAA